MPAPIYYAHRILFEMSKLRHSGELPELGPDAKSQVTLYYENGKPVRTTSIVVSTQHGEDVSPERVRDIVGDIVFGGPSQGWMCPKDDFYVNPTGRFVVGGPDGDAGLTGRKIIVDTYGGAAPHGGGAFSGKDPTKVDRSAAYAARYVAKNVVAAGLADKCSLQLSYAIGVAKPLSIYADLYGTGRVDESKLESVLHDIVDPQPSRHPRDAGAEPANLPATASYGHFGRAPEKDGGFSWKRLDLVDTLKDALS